MKVQKIEGLKALENAPLNLHMLRNHHACVRSWRDLTLSLPIALTTPRESTKKTPLQRQHRLPACPWWSFTLAKLPASLFPR